jgi:hypothetical protein
MFTLNTLLTSYRQFQTTALILHKKALEGGIEEAEQFSSRGIILFLRGVEGILPTPHFICTC